MDKGENYVEIDLMKLLNALWHRLWLIILAAIVGGSALFSYAAFLVTPLYQAETLMYVNNSSFSLGGTSVSISASELTAAKTLVDTYIVILKSRSTLNDVIQETGVPYTYSQLSNMISSSAVNNTEVFSVKVTSSKPKEAEKLANTIARILPSKIADVVDGSSVRIVDYAVVPTTKTSPDITRYTVIGAMLGILVSCGIIFIIMLMDNVVRDDEYLINTYHLPVLAAIPNLHEQGGGYYYSHDAKRRQSNDKTQ